jgi:hypothetical protein
MANEGLISSVVGRVAVRVSHTDEEPMQTRAAGGVEILQLDGTRWAGALAVNAIFFALCRRVDFRS